MEKSHVKTFYHNVADEVDQHFARALQSTTTSVQGGPAQNQGGPTGGEAVCWAHQPTDQQQPYHHADVGTAYSPSLSLSPSCGGTSVYPESVFQVPPDASSFVCPPPPSLISGCPNSGGTTVLPESSHLHHLDVNSFSVSPAPPSFGADNSSSRGTIVYPEFIDHLVHPDVDSFKDIPRLPGQTDPRGRYV